MTAFALTTYGSNASDATFRVWTKSIFDTIIAGGWVQTADAGQMSFTTVAVPTVINTSAGYVIFAMNDALQATAPCYLKMEFGQGTSLGYLNVWLTMGTATSGTGGIIGNTTSRFSLGTNQGATTVGQTTFRYSIAPNRLTAGLFVTNTAGYYSIFTVERTKDGSGNDTATGLMIMGYSQAAAASGVQGVFSQLVTYAGPQAPYYAAWNATTPPGITTSAYGADIYFYPIRGGWGYGEGSLVTGLMHYMNIDVTPYNIINVKMWDGVYRNVYPFGVVGSSYGSSPYIMMRFD